MLGIANLGTVYEVCSNDDATCGFVNCCVNCVLAATRSALVAATRNMIA